MKYLLAIEFLCEIYRKEPRARIFLNDHLLDEFFIEQNKETKKNIDNQNILKPTPTIQTIKNLKELDINKLKVYELEIPKEYIDLNIKIQIENNDNNYTNGFMTRSTLITLKHFYLIPLHKKIIQRIRKIRAKQQFNENYAWWQSQKSSLTLLMSNTIWVDKERTITQLAGQRIGTSGNFICELRKKYGILMHKNPYPYIVRLDQLPLINYFLNKYEKNEN